MNRKNQTDKVGICASFRTIRALRRSQPAELAKLGSSRTVGLWAWAGLCEIGFVLHNRALATAGRPGREHGCAKQSQLALDQVARGPAQGLRPARIPRNEPNSPGRDTHPSTMLSPSLVEPGVHRAKRSQFPLLGPRRRILCPPPQAGRTLSCSDPATADGRPGRD